MHGEDEVKKIALNALNLLTSKLMELRSLDREMFIKKLKDKKENVLHKESALYIKLFLDIIKTGHHIESLLEILKEDEREDSYNYLSRLFDILRNSYYSNGPSQVVEHYEELITFIRNTTINDYKGVSDYKEQ